MTSSISSTPPSLAVPTRLPANNSVAAKRVAGADRALHALLNDKGMLDALASNSSTYLPPTYNQILSLLWGASDTNGDTNVTRRELEHAVIVAGGSTSDGDALWSQLNKADPSGTSSLSLISARSFAANTYLGSAILSNLSAEQKAVQQDDIQNQALDNSSTGSVLLYMFGGSSTSNSSAGNAVNIFA